jgi:hypothetical protein
MKRNLMNELKEGMGALTEDRHMTRDQLLKDYAAIIDKQKEEISGLHAELEYYRGFAEQLGAKKAVSEKQQWEACADKLFIFAEIVKAIEGNSTRNPEYYNRACEVIEEYNRLKSNV